MTELRGARAGQWAARAAPIVLVGVAFLLRAYHLATPPLAWDEGWSLAISQLPLAELAYLTAYDVHPPGYYLLLKPWLALGHSEFVIRYVSLVVGVLAVPLAYQAARVWVGREGKAAQRVGWLAAGYVAIAPLLIYYSQVARMYALCVSGALLATWGLLRCLDPRSPAPWPGLLGWLVGALVAVYSFYYSLLALAGLALYAVWRSRPLWRTTAGRWGLARLGGASVALVVLYTPWLVYTAEPVLDRVAGRAGAETGSRLEQIVNLLSAGVFALVFGYGPGWPAVWALGAVVAAGVAVVVWRWRGAGAPLPVALLVLPLLAIGLTLLGVAAGTQAHMFAARYTIGASPFLALAVAYGIAALGGTSRRLGAVALAVVALASLWPLGSGDVYAKELERSGAWDPAADARTLRAAGARADDIVVFNLLSLAGAYDAYRQPGDPPWTYAQRWDPVTEEKLRVEERLRRIADSYPRVWVNLYKGTVAGNALIKDTLDRRLYPTRATWREDTLTLLYQNEVEPRQTTALQTAWPAGPILDQALYTAQASAGGGVTVDLKWQTPRDLNRDYNVFVHLYDSAGRLVAQHDGPPRNGQQPTSSWPTGRAVIDYHGLLIPPGTRGSLTLRVGLYDAATGQRLPLADGRDMVDIGRVEIVT